jgi:hypothetical protein
MLQSKQKLVSGVIDHLGCIGIDFSIICHLLQRVACIPFVIAPASAVPSCTGNNCSHAHWVPVIMCVYIS